MATYTTSDFKPGLKFMQDGEPCVIVENEFVKPGSPSCINFRPGLKSLVVYVAILKIS